jgi:LCP family protein required for cell wall assembly
MQVSPDEGPKGTRRERRAGRRARRRERHARHPWRHRLAVISICLVVFLALIAGGAYGYLLYRDHQIHRIAVRNLVPVPSKQTAYGPKVGVQTFLLIGSTSRCALNGKQAGAFGSCAAGVTGVNSDVIILLRADQNTHTISILSIPRDLVLENVRNDSQKFYKVDAALADGPSQLVAVIEQDFGIPINHFAELNFDTFQNIVNALGGINMYFPFPETDNYSSLDVKTAGCHHLNGFEALAVVRARHLSYYDKGQWQYDGSGDLGRIIRVHEFLRVLATSLQQRGLGNPFTDNSIIGAIAPQLTVDSGLSLHDMIDLVLAFHHVNPLSAPQETLPNIEDHNYYYWEGIDFGSVVLPTYPQDQKAIDAFEGWKTPPSATMSPSSVTVSVVDGTGNQTGTAKFQSKLASLGFQVSSGGSRPPVGPISEATVYYRPGHLAQAERVMDSLSGIVAMAQGPTVGHADVEVVTGSNFSVVLPGIHHHHGASHGPGSYSVLGPPSSALQALPFYDPRACTAAQIAAMSKG